MNSYKTPKKPQILVIDDTPSNLKIVATTLKTNGFSVLLAANGKQGLAIAQAKLPDLILLDIMMPEMSGYDVCKALKNDEKTKAIPIIFLTAAIEIESVIQGFELGAVDYIVKPFNPSELLMRVKTHLDLKISKEIIFEQKQELDFAISGSHIGVWNCNLEAKWLHASDTFVKMIGYDVEEIGTSYDNILLFVHPDDRIPTEARLKQMVDGSVEQFEAEFRIRCKDDAYKWILSKGKVIRKDSSGKPLHLIGTHIDITKLKETEEQIRLLSMAVQQSVNSIIITDPQGTIVFVNRHFLEKTGYIEAEVIGKNPRIVKSGKQSDEFYKELWNTITSGKEWRGELCNRKKNGELYWELATISSIKDENGIVRYYLAIEEDITEKKKLEDELYYYSTTDSMTQAYNRRTGLELLKKMIYLSKRQNQPLTICFMDLNHLKMVNDTYGHQEGDNYIRLICDQIKAELRQSDSLVRMGGDEFLLIFPNCTIDQAQSILSRFTAKLNDINQADMYPFTASVSFGFAQYHPEDEPNYEALIEQADNEMYRHKQRYKQSMQGISQSNSRLAGQGDFSSFGYVHYVGRHA